MFENMNDNKYFIGLMMIVVNIGSRFIIGELSDEQKKLINDKMLRRIFIFGVFFMATRDIISSLVLTIMFYLSQDYLMKIVKFHYFLKKKIVKIIQIQQQ